MPKVSAVRNAKKGTVRITTLRVHVSPDSTVPTRPHLILPTTRLSVTLSAPRRPRRRQSEGHHGEREISRLHTATDIDLYHGSCSGDSSDRLHLSLPAVLFAAAFRTEGLHLGRVPAALFAKFACSSSQSFGFTYEQRYSRLRSSIRPASSIATRWGNRNAGLADRMLRYHSGQ